MKQSSPPPALRGDSIVAALTQLGYFRFAATPQLVGALQQEMATSYDTARVLASLYEEATNAPYCFRLYDCDAEDLFEVGGLVTQLAAIKPTFDQLGVPLTWSADHWSPDQRRHTVVLNGQYYLAFEGDPTSPKSWALATKHFVEMVSDQLARHHSPERVYPILGGNDGWIVFLTPPLYAFIRYHFDPDEGPKELSQWWADLG